MRAGETGHGGWRQTLTSQLPTSLTLPLEGEGRVWRQTFASRRNLRIEGGGRVLTAFAILTDGLVYAAYLFLVAVGLTLIFGVMKILNVTHGSFYAFGAYGAATAVGIYFDRGLPDAGGFLFMILLAMAIGLVLGFVLERGVLRFVYGKDEVVIVLVTYACFLILEDVITLIWGPRSYAAYQPMVAAGSIDIGELTLSNYDIVLVAIAAAGRDRWSTGR